MPRVLIVTSMFLPYLAADAHRARLLARELPKQGWDVELLVPGGDFQRADYEEPYAELLNVSVPIHRATPEWAALFRLLSSRTLSWRAYRPLRRLGDSLLSRRRFDLVYISCSQVNFFHLGVRWRRRFKVPFIIDLHDPWYTPSLSRTTHLPNWKRQFGNLIARFLERSTLRAAAGLVSVSAKYLEDLDNRYGGECWNSLASHRQATIPFGPSEDDLRAAGQLPGPPQQSGTGGDIRTIVYTGAGGPIMADSFRQLCRLLAATRRSTPALLSGVKIQLFGTEPEAVGREPLLSRIAAQEGVSELIVEFPARLGYLEALRRVMDADGLLVLGVADPAYIPSKLFLYALSGKPLLACMRSGTTVQSYFDAIPGLGRLVHFQPGFQGTGPEASGVLKALLEDVAGKRTVDRRPLLVDFLAPAMARRHVELFEACIEAKSIVRRPELEC